MGDSPTPIWGRAWYHLLCSEVPRRPGGKKKMIEAREIFAPVYANSLYTAELRGSQYWSRLARMMNLPDSAPEPRRVHVLRGDAGQIMRVARPPWQSSQPVETESLPTQEFTLLSRGSRVRVAAGAPTLVESFGK